VTRASVEKLVRAYAKQAAPLERRGSGGPEQLPAGAAILALDVEERAQAVVATYRALPRNHVGGWGRRIMLGLLATTLLKKKLPLDASQLEAMAASCARAVSPAWGPCDYDAALVKILGGAVVLTKGTQEALRAIAVRRGKKFAVDRRVSAACERLAS